MEIVEGGVEAQTVSVATLIALGPGLTVETSPVQHLQPPRRVQLVRLARPQDDRLHQGHERLCGHQQDLRRVLRRDQAGQELRRGCQAAKGCLGRN